MFHPQIIEHHYYHKSQSRVRNAKSGVRSPLLRQSLSSRAIWMGINKGKARDEVFHRRL